MQTRAISAGVFVLLLLAPLVLSAQTGRRANAICDGLKVQYNGCALGTWVQDGGRKLQCKEGLHCQESDEQGPIFTGVCQWKDGSSSGPGYGGECLGKKLRGDDGRLHDAEIPDLSKVSVPPIESPISTGVQALGGAVADFFTKAFTEAFGGAPSESSGEISSPHESGFDSGWSSKGDLLRLAGYGGYGEPLYEAQYSPDSSFVTNDFGDTSQLSSGGPEPLDRTPSFARTGITQSESTFSGQESPASSEQSVGSYAYGFAHVGSRLPPRPQFHSMIRDRKSMRLAIRE